MERTEYLGLSLPGFEDKADIRVIADDHQKLDIEAKRLSDDKANQAYVEAELANKVNTTDVYTKSEIGSLNLLAYLSGIGETNWDSGNLKIEQGDWTPELYGSKTAGNVSYAHRSGQYVTIGDIVLLTFTVAVSDTGGATGDVRFRGFPFVAKNIGFSGHHGNMNGKKLPSGTRLSHTIIRNDSGNFVCQSEQFFPVLQFSEVENDFSVYYATIIYVKG